MALYTHWETKSLWCQLCNNWWHFILTEKPSHYDANFVITGGILYSLRNQVIMMPTLSLLVAPQVVVTTTCSATSGRNLTSWKRYIYMGHDRQHDCRVACSSAIYCMTIAFTCRQLSCVTHAYNPGLYAGVTHDSCLHVNAIVVQIPCIDSSWVRWFFEENCSQQPVPWGNLKVDYLIICIICDTDSVNKLTLQMYTLHKYK